MSKPIDLSPGRKSIAARYGVHPPRQELAAILADYVNAETVAAILQRLGQADAKYQRAVKVDQARRSIQGAHPEVQAFIREKRVLTIHEKALRRDMELLDHAAEFIEGTWRP